MLQAWIHEGEPESGLRAPQLQSSRPVSLGSWAAGWRIRPWTRRRRARVGEKLGLDMEFTGCQHRMTSPVIWQALIAAEGVVFDSSAKPNMAVIAMTRRVFDLRCLLRCSSYKRRSTMAPSTTSRSCPPRAPRSGRGKAKARRFRYMVRTTEVLKAFQGDNGINCIKKSSERA